MRVLESSTLRYIVVTMRSRKQLESSGQSQARAWKQADQSFSDVRQNNSGLDETRMANNDLPFVTKFPKHHRTCTEDLPPFHIGSPPVERDSYVWRYHLDLNPVRGE